MNILEIVNKLKATPGTNDKIKILKENEKNEIFRKILKYTYDPANRFWIKSGQLKDCTIQEFISNKRKPLDEVLNALILNLCTRFVTGNAAAEFARKELALVSSAERDLLRDMIDGDLKCGINIKSINKVHEGLIKKPEFMLAQTDPKKIVYPAFSQIKADGVRVKLIKTHGKYKLLSRNGKTIETLGNFNSAFINSLKDGDRVDGEIVSVDKSGELLDRKTGNGIINKAIRGTISFEEAKTLRILAWDIENIQDTYSYRLHVLANKIFEDKSGKFECIESRNVNSYAEAKEHFVEARRLGYEGTILKNRDSVWEPKRSFSVVKFKAEHEADFLVTGYELGTGKNAGRIGNIYVESQDGNVKCAVGIFKGMPETVRDDWLTEMPRVVTILYNERIKAKKSDTYSLFLPRIVQGRFDKDEADNLEKIQEQEDAVLNI